MLKKPEYYYQAILLTMTVIVFLGVISSIDVFESELRVKKFDEGLKVEKSLEKELSFKDLELSSNQSGPIKNLIQNQSDQRQSSYKEYSQDIDAGDASSRAAEEFEKSLWEQAEGNSLRKELDEKRQNQLLNPENTKEISHVVTPKNNQYAGRVMVSFKVGLQRTAFNNNNWYVRNPGYTCNKGSGRVVVNVVVSSNGRVKKATINRELSVNANQCMLDKGLEYARMSRFNILSSMNQEETGYISYEFISQ